MPGCLRMRAARCYRQLSPMNWRDSEFTQDVLRLAQAMRRRVSRRQFLTLAGRSLLGAAVLGGGGVVYASRIEPYWFEVKQVTLTLPRLHPDFDGFRLAQLSDIHVSDVVNSEQLGQAVAAILEQQPDLVAITGDFADRTYGIEAGAPVLVERLRPLAAAVETVAVLGNHDYSAGVAEVRQVLRACQIRELDNRVHSLVRGGARLHIAGVDDVWERRARLSRVLAQLDGDHQAAILLAHEPDFADSAAMSGRFDLQLSGHSHGGQVVIPLVGPLVLPYYARKYPVGQYQLGKMIHYTNRGLGAIPPRVRLNCRPEITIFTLRSGQFA